jgi:photosystem II stability/assembly factor-like uncharacterized protein
VRRPSPCLVRGLAAYGGPGAYQRLLQARSFVSTRQLNGYRSRMKIPAVGLPAGPPVLVILVAAALVLGGCSGGNSSRPATGSHPTTTAPKSSSTVSPATTAGGPSGGPVPAGFQAQSATFVSADQGWVLGKTPCASGPCTSVVRTSDDGATWSSIPAPTDGLENPQSSSTTGGVNEIRFADHLNGWVFGPDLWSTHDGGTTWSHITSGPGASPVVDLESSGGSVYVVTERCSLQASVCPGQLWRGDSITDRFDPVAGFDLEPANGNVLPVLVLHDTTGYLVTAAANGTVGPALMVTANGTTWSAEPDPCPAQLDELSVAPVDTVRAAMLCSGEGASGSTTKAVLATSDGGHTWVPEGQAPPSGGDGGTLSAASVSTLAIATSSGASEVYRSVDGGATWTTPLSLADGGEGWGDFGFTDSTHGLAVHAPIGRYQTVSPGAPASTGTGSLYLTSNAGATWSVVVF